MVPLYNPKKNELQKILNDRFNHLIFQTIPDAYIVGGYLRDLFLGGESKDRDYAVRNDPGEVARIINNYIGGTVVILKHASTARVALKGGITLDFTRYGRDIKEDLFRRDFTFNAMAFSPDRGLYDPAEGLSDLRKGRVRMISERNLIDDPVRFIRAYRFVGELDGYIDVDTRDAIRRNKGLLQDSPPERITLEFFKLLQSKAYLKALKLAFEDTIINMIIPFKNSKLDEVFQELVEVNEKLERLPEDFSKRLKDEISQELTLKGLIILDILLEDADMESTRLSLSRKIRDRIIQFKKGSSEKKDLKNLTDKELFDYFSGLGDSIIEVTLIKGNMELLGQAERFRKISKEPLLNGEEIKRALKLEEGRLIGRLLHELKKSEFIGRINERKEAIDYLKGLSQVREPY